MAHFEDQVSPERTPRPSPAVMGRAKNIPHYLKSHTNVQFMHFLLDTLDFLKALSLQFQLDNLTPGEAVQYIEACLIGFPELCLEPGEQQRKMLADAMNGTYRSVELYKTPPQTHWLQTGRTLQTCLPNLLRAVWETCCLPRALCKNAQLLIIMCGQLR